MGVSLAVVTVMGVFSGCGVQTPVAETENIDAEASADNAETLQESDDETMQTNEKEGTKSEDVTKEAKSEAQSDNGTVSDADILTGNPEAGAVTAYYEDGSEVILTENTDGTYLTGDGVIYYLGEDGIYRSRGKADLHIHKPQTSNQESGNIITKEQALEAIKKYCFKNDPDLEEMMDSEDNAAYFDVSTNEEGEIVVLYRSYTAAQTRYYINPSSGEVYVTELVPGIIDDEQRTDENFNINTYLN